MANIKGAPRSRGGAAAQARAKASMAATRTLAVPPYARPDQVPYGTPGASTVSAAQIGQRRK